SAMAPGYALRRYGRLQLVWHRRGQGRGLPGRRAREREARDVLPPGARRAVDPQRPALGGRPDPGAGRRHRPGRLRALRRGRRRHPRRPGPPPRRAPHRRRVLLGRPPARVDQARRALAHRRVSLTADDARRLALALPDAIEADHHGRPSFRVAGKIFATLWDPEHLNVMLGPEQIRAAVERAPDVCSEVWWGKKLSAVRVELAAISPL